MRALRTVAAAAAYVVALYAALWAVSSLWADTPAGGIDTARGDDDLYRMDHREFLYRLPGFCQAAATSGQRNILFVGGSTLGAYDPKITGRSFPGMTVSRIALDFGNITQMRQSIALLRACMTPESFRNATIVLGVSFVSFATNKNRFQTPYTTLELEQLRHGLFAGPPGNVQPMLSWRAQVPAIVAMRPVFAAYAASDWLSKRITDLRLARLRSAPAVDVATKRNEEIALFDRLGGTPADVREQMDELATLAADVRGTGAGFVLLRIPEQPYVAERAKRFGDYDRLLTELAASHAIPLVRHSALPADFRDGVHANPEGAKRWSAAAGPLVAAALGDPRISKPQLP